MTESTLLSIKKRAKLPVTLQTEVAECGLTCLSMIAGYYGYDTDLHNLRRRFPVSLKGATLQHIIQIGEQLDLSSRALRVELEALESLQTPAILHWDLNHFVVLKEVSGSKVVIHDPARGRKVLTLEELSKHFTGIAVELTPTKSFKPQKAVEQVRLLDFLRTTGGIKKAFGQLLVLSVLLQIFAIASPFYMQLVVDQALTTYDRDLLTVLAIGFFLLALIKVVTNGFRSWVIVYLGNTLSFQMGGNLFRHLIHLPLDFFEKRHIGDLIARFGSMDAIQKILTTGMVSALVDGVMAIATFVMMWLYAPLLALLVAGVVLTYTAIRLALFRPLRTLTEEEIVARAKEQSNFMESLRAIQSIKIFGKESDRQSLWKNCYADVANSRIRLGKFRVSYTAINELLFGIENVLVVYLGASMVLDGGFSVGMLFAFISYKTQFTQKTSTLIEQIIEFRMVGLHLSRLSDIALTEKENTGEALVCDHEFKGELALKNIDFRYSDTDPYLFKGLNLHVKQGEALAIVGPSGCGKSTLMKVMMGLLPAEGGEIEYDGRKLSELGLKPLREHIGAVMQDDQLLSGSIADNIAFFDPTPDEESIEDCAKLASVHQDVAQMPMGYQSLIGDMGTTLSGGQKQRVLLARALYRQPRLLFMDEATSHLDVQTERVVNGAIKALDITRVIIAHRPETIRTADRVLLLEQGVLRDVTPPGLNKPPSGLGPLRPS
ncbi:MAG: peptidase domain-containing ABC transporter [Gammaproteobacteria bacterium]|nr:peptidase domain-containing ABC transporter [Gammaproteobacteria bacterium]MBQ0840883.1 peptidase domain-containing ABC transporter [Gammaproteobacteria bacterium]